MEHFYPEEFIERALAVGQWSWTRTTNTKVGDRCQGVKLSRTMGIGTHPSPSERASVSEDTAAGYLDSISPTDVQTFIESTIWVGNNGLDVRGDVHNLHPAVSSVSSVTLPKLRNMSYIIIKTIEYKTLVSQEAW